MRVYRALSVCLSVLRTGLSSVRPQVTRTFARSLMLLFSPGNKGTFHSSPSYTPSITWFANLVSLLLCKVRVRHSSVKPLIRLFPSLPAAMFTSHPTKELTQLFPDMSKVAGLHEDRLVCQGYGILVLIHNRDRDSAHPQYGI